MTKRGNFLKKEEQKEVTLKHYIFYKKTQRRCNFKHTVTYCNFGKEPLSLQINTLKAIHAHTATGTFHFAGAVKSSSQHVKFE